MPPARKIPLPVASGQILSETEYQAEGRYTVCDHIRFKDGQPEKIGGWAQWNLPGQGVTPVCRSILVWMDFNYNLWHAFGTSSRLWVYDQNAARTNVTPFSVTGTLGNPFSTTNGSTTVTVAHTAHGNVVGQFVNFSGATALGGITVSGEYAVVTVIDANSYTITHASAATSTAGPGGGASVAYSYELAAGNVSVTVGGGWGIGTWGTGTWGTVRGSNTYLQYQRHWSLDRYGQDLLAMPTGGGLYRWQRNTANRAAAVANAPTQGQFMFVTSERIVVVLGADNDLMLMKWCDDDDPTVWTPADTNTANIRRLQEGTRLVAGARLAQGVNLVWSDTSVYLMQFTANNRVYSTRAIASNCGLIGPGAFTVVDGAAFWMSNSTFYVYSGQLSVIPRAAEIEAIFLAMNDTQRPKVNCHFNPTFREIWWLYPSTGSAEPDRYVMVNIDSFDWATGTLDRTAFGMRILSGAYQPLAVDQAGTIYQHDVGVDADGIALGWQIETGFFDIEDGNAGINIDGYIPDFARQTGAITITVSSKDLPEDTATLDVVTKTIAPGDTIVDLRHFGRQCKLRLEQQVVGGDFRLGGHRLEVAGTATNRHD
jgi:hypothetical protein